MVLLDLQGISTLAGGRPAFESDMSMTCTPESNVSMALCDDDPNPSNLSVLACTR